ncbi:cation:proton antiporter, partial [Myxococcota bacterium]|nr:cation:proton antiporter [Myxococcota bacterium]
MELDVRVGIGLLVAAITVAVAAKRVNVPYNIALVIGGMLIALTGVLPSAPRLEPEIVFVICLPALLFEGGISADLRSIRADAAPILLLAVLGMIVSIATTGVLFSVLLDFPWIAGLLLGAAMSATDTVAVLYAFRRVPVPPRLSGLVQGESLFNDGTALVAYSTLAAIAVGGVALTPTVLATKLVAVTVGGAAVGIALALGAGVLVRWTEDPLTEIMVTTALAFAAYVAAEELHLSGAIAAVAAGLTMGATVRRTSSPPAQVAISSFWEYVAFGVNTLLFLLVGLSTRPDSIVAHLPETGVAVLCVFAGRAVGIYGPSALWNLVARERAIPLRWQGVFVIGNIKGAISIALALGLPATLAGREQMIDVAFGVTFVSLVGQGLLLTGVLRRMGLFTTDPIAD